MLSGIRVINMSKVVKKTNFCEIKNSDFVLFAKVQYTEQVLLMQQVDCFCNVKNYKFFVSPQD